MDIKIIAENVFADGYHVASLHTDGVPSTVQTEFSDMLQNAFAVCEVDCLEAAMNRLRSRLLLDNKAGLVSMSNVLAEIADVQKIYKEKL